MIINIGKNFSMYHKRETLRASLLMVDSFSERRIMLVFKSLVPTLVRIR